MTTRNEGGKLMARSSNLNVQITGDSRSLSKATRDAGGALDKLGRQTALTARVTQRGFSGIGLAAKGAAAATVGLTAGVGFLVKQFEESNKIAKQTQAVLKSTGGAAGVTAKQVSDLATAISKKTGVDDEAIQSGENLLLTFTNLRNEAGKGNDIFNQTTSLLVDMSVALGQDTKSSAIQLGKALNDPVKGITALQRVGVSFTADQKKQISTLVESGKTLDAQKVILHELNKEFGGSAEAQATGFDKLKVSAGNLAEAAGGVLAPALSTVSDSLSDFLNDLVEGKGPVAGFIGSVAKVPGKVIDEFNKLKDEKGGAGAAIGAMIVNGIDSIDWAALGEKVSQGFNAALKIGGKVGSAIVDAFQQVPWDKVGDAIGAGVEGSLNFADTLPSKISAGISAAVSQVNGRQVLGKLVDIIGQAIDALFSPSFWAEHWKGIFATVTLAIPFAKILKVPGAATLFKFISKPVFDAIGFLGKGMLSLFGKAASEAGLSFLAQLEHVLPRTANLMLRLVTGAGRALASLPGKLAGIAADAADAVARKLGSATGTIVGKMTGWVISGVKALGRLVGRVAQEGSVIGRSILSGIVAGLGTLGHAIFNKVKDALGWVGGQIKGAAGFVGKLIGDGIGKGAGDGAGRSLPSGGAFGGSLMGAQTALKPFAAIGSRFGLNVTSGRRPGSITSSGNISYHSSGEAIDMGDGRGPDANKLNFFKYMKGHFGGRLAELIYTPGGAGVKDGHPHTYTGQVAADHYDHVHVAFDTGRPGVGDGLGKFTASAYGPPWGGIQGTGVTATGVNLKGAPHTYGVAVDPKVIPLGSKLKITPNPFNYSGAFTAFDTGGAIKGKRIDFYDWRGRQAQMGWGMRSVSVSTASGSSGGGGSSKGGSKGKPTHGTDTVKPSGPEFSKYPDEAADTGLTPEQQAAKDFMDKTRGPGKGTSARAPRKGLTAEEAQALGLGRDQTDPNQPLIDAINELAKIEQQKIALEGELAANQTKILALAGQGPQILAAVIAAVNGGIGGQVGLGLQTPGYAGAVASYAGGSAGRL